MKNPNAFAAFVATQSVLGIQWILAHYWHVQLSQWWRAEIIAGVTIVVLFVGREGIKGALLRVWTGVRTTWSPPKPAVRSARARSTRARRAPSARKPGRKPGADVTTAP